MKIRELPILARIDPKTQKTHAAAKKCCGWEKPAICLQVMNVINDVLVHITIGLLQFSKSFPGRVGDGLGSIRHNGCWIWYRNFTNKLKEEIVSFFIFTTGQDCTNSVELSILA